MALRKVEVLTSGEDEIVNELKPKIEAHEYVVHIRDIEKEPLTEDQVRRLLGHLRLEHFLNPFSDSYAKHKLDEQTSDREEVIQLITADPSLLRRPIFMTTRLMLVGADPGKLSEMLQVDLVGDRGAFGADAEQSSGRESSRENGAGNSGGSHRGRRSGSRSHRSQQRSR